MRPALVNPGGFYARGEPRCWRCAVAWWGRVRITLRALRRDLVYLLPSGLPTARKEAPMTKPTAFWVDDDYDREYASDGVSRYAHYVNQHPPFKPWTDNDQDVELAVFAWDRATGPIMAPGYVRRHSRILAVQLERNEWDGSLAAAVNLITGRPAELREQSTAHPGTRGWLSWPTETVFASDSIRYLDPSGEDLTNGSYLLPSVSLRFKLATPSLPWQPARAADFVAICRHAVALVVAALNSMVDPVLEALESS
jgi:hypothetical protein